MKQFWKTPSLLLVALTVPVGLLTAGPAGLVAAYNFNEGSGTTVADASGNGNAGVVTGATWNASGRYGSALTFNGTSSNLVTIPDSPSLDLTNGMTVEGWVYRASGSGWRTVVLKEQPGGLTYALYANTSSNRPAGTINTGNDTNLYGAAQVATNTWVHLATTYDGSTLRLFVNGVQSVALAVGGPITVSGGVLRIGGNSIWGEYFTGRIDEVRVYNRALIAAEIQTDMSTPISTASVTGITATPSSVTFTTAGGTQQLTVTANYSDGSTQNVTNNTGTTYGSNNTAVATVNATGLVTAVANGSATITASFGSFSAPFNATVNIPPPVQTGVTVAPTSFTLTAAGATQQLTVTAVYSNGSTQNVTSNAATTYVSNNTAVATVGATGSVTAVANGTASVTASFGGFSAQASATVNIPPPQTGLSATPVSFTLTSAGAIQQLAVTATYSNGSTQDVTSNAATTYLSNNTAVATVNSTGRVTAVANGSATITASYGGFSAPAGVTVDIPPPVQTGVSVTPGTFTLTALGATQQLTVTANFSDGSTQNVTANPGTTYGSNNTAVATVGAGGLVAAVANGNAILSASYGGFSGNANVTVNTTPAPTGLVAAYNFNEGSGSSVADASGTGNNGTINGATWTASGKYGSALTFNGTSQWVTVNGSASLNLTSAMTVEGWVYRTTGGGWRTVVLKERPAGLSYGLYANTDSNLPAAAVNTGSDTNLYGSSQISLNAWNHVAGTYDGSTLRLYVNGAQVATQALPGPFATAIGSPLRIGGNSVWGEYFVGRIDEVRVYNRALSLAEIQTDMNTPITAAPVTGITAAPSSFTITTVGGTQQLAVTANYSDGSTQNVTNSAGTTYLSNNTAVATVSATGLVTAGANGSATITASFGGFSAPVSATVNIPPPVQTGVTVAPTSFTLTAAGTTQQLTVTAVYSNGSTQNVTSNAVTTYASNNTAVATVSATGLVTAVANGTAAITGSYGGFSAHASAIVNTSLPSGLVGAYSFNEGIGTAVGDSSGSGNPGVISGASWVSSGRFGGALSFDGVNDMVTINDSASLDLTSGMTLEAWVYPRSLLGWQTAMLKERTSDFAYALYVNNGDADVPMASTTIGTSTRDLVGRSQLQNNNWAHIAATYNGSVLRLYVNGFEAVNLSTSGQIVVSSGVLRIGGNTIWGEYFNGLIDEVRVYNRALTPAELLGDMYRPINSPALSQLDVSPSSFTLPAAGALQQLTLTGTYVNGLVENTTLNTGVSYTSSNSAVATVSSTGLVRGVANGTATITVSYGGFVRTAAASVSITSDQSQVGQWSQPVNIGVVAVNQVLLRTGKVLIYGGVTSSGTAARVFDPATNLFTATPNNATDLFCTGTTALADGRIFVVGGHDTLNGILGENDANIFDPVTQQWTSLPKMTYRRWYPTATTLPDGRVLVTSGGTTCLALSCIVDEPEIYDPATNSWTRLSAASAKWNLWYYPFQYLLPDGRIIVTGSSEQPTFTRTFNVATQTWTTLDPNPVGGGSSTMYAPGRILQSGSASDGGRPDSPASNMTVVLDMNTPSPAWQKTAPMAAPRGYSDLTVLPDGSVLATSGQFTLDGFNGANAVLQAELWSPSTMTWKTMSLAQVPRMYHSSAVLLPDGRILVGGSGSLYPSVDQNTIEYYSPPYLFKGARPVITSAPSAITYGGNFAIQTPDASNISSIALIRPSAVTHQFNEDQHFLNLSFQNNAGSLTVQAPANANLAPPGYYMLFIVNTNGVPSIAPFVKMQ